MKFTFKPYRSDKTSSQVDLSPSEPQGSKQKRREQIRRAQKTHRDRKEAYIKSLEIEVVQLRANEAKILQETKALYFEISTLKEVLTDKDIPFPVVSLQGPESVQSEQDLEQSYDVDIRGQNGRQQLQIQRSVKGLQKQQYQQPSANLERSFETKHQSPYPPNYSSPLLAIGFAAGDKCLGEFDIAALGIDFVLSLENPCLHHISLHEENQIQATGHALTVTATLLHQQPSVSSGKHQTSVPAWKVSAAGVDRLLQLSNDIPLDGEVTPVQAWDHIRRHPQYEGVEITRLESLRTTLLKHIKCYGFGGVIDQGIFENAVFDAFVVGRVF